MSPDIAARSRRIAFALGLTAAFALGCSAAPPVPVPPVGCPGCPFIDEDRTARVLFDEGLAALAKHDRERSFTPSVCIAIGNTFLEAERAIGKHWLQARYNAGIALLRCGDVAGAAELFQSILALDDHEHQARVALALLQLEASHDLDHAIAEFSRAVLDSQFRNGEALIELARAQLARDSSQADADGADDFTRANKNLRRALFVDERSLPANNLLAVFYLESARKRAVSTSDGARVAAQELEMARQVAAQTLADGPTYAPVHNTLGVIAALQNDLPAAARMFERASTLDPSFFQAHMNFASVSFGFRDLPAAERGYRAALRVRPDDYDALVGLALTLRAAGESAPDGAAAQSEAQLLLTRAKQIAPKRPEAHVGLDALGAPRAGAVEPSPTSNETK